MTAVFVLFMTVSFFGNGYGDLVVRTKQGSLVGTEMINRITKEPYYAFLGVPFAKPPIGPLRFKDPEDPVPWVGVFNATQEANACMSYSIKARHAEGDEDCLKLNIFTLKKPQDIMDSPRPVMFWIHGGAFMTGSGSLSKYGPDFLIRYDVVLVSINYRLNVFGFLSVQNDFVPGNAGLKDQVKALEWVRENIAAFGGDPNCVTIFGQSAGAASVHYLMLSPSARGLFHRAIAQSGVALEPWASVNDVKEAAINSGKFFDCDTENPNDLVECLQRVDAKDLVSHQFDILNLENTNFLRKNIFIPCLEANNTKNSFMTEPALKLMEAGDFADVPFMLGVVVYESLLLQKFSEKITEGMSMTRPKLIEFIIKHPEVLLPRNLYFPNPKLAREAGQRIVEFYFLNKTASEKSDDPLISFISDGWFVYGVHRTAILHSKNGVSPVYLYLFLLDHEFGEPGKGDKHSKPGPTHSDDLKYLFYRWKNDIEIPPRLMESISKINSLWINFAKYGNPTPDENTSGMIWKPFNHVERNYFEIGDEFKLKTDLEKERMLLWQNLTEQSFART